MAYRLASQHDPQREDGVPEGGHSRRGHRGRGVDVGVDCDDGVWHSEAELLQLHADSEGKVTTS